MVGEEEENTGFEELDEEAEIEALSEYARNVLTEYKKGTHVLVPENVNRLYTAYKLTQEIFEGQDVKITLWVGEHFMPNGYFKIEGSVIDIKDIKKFIRVCELTDSVVVDPTLDGGCHLSFSVLSITKKVS